MAKVLYYNVPDTLDYERGLLEKWGVDDIELTEIKDPEHKRDFGASLAASGADGLVVIYEDVTRAVLDACPNLKIISLQSIGYNNIDIKAATDHRVCVTNVPGYCTEEVATHAIGMAIDLARKISFLDRDVRNGHWNPVAGYPVCRMSGKTFGLVFFGSIPQKMTPVLKALGMRVLVYAPTKTAEELASFGCEKAETLDGLLAESDFVSLHCPLIPGVTDHLMGEEQFHRMKKSAYFINTARGACVDEAALANALKTGEITAAAVDVLENEDNVDSPLIGLSNCIVTPHAAFMSEDSYYEERERCLRHLCERLAKRLAARPGNLVNPEVEYVSGHRRKNHI